MSLAISNRNGPQYDQDWVAIPFELLIGIFGELEPEDLIRSSEACQRWYRTSLNSDLYLNLAHRVKYFCCNCGPASFATDPKSKFIRYYTSLQALPHPKEKTHYQALRHFLSSEGVGDLNKVWNMIIPPIEKFQKSSSSILEAFPYQVHLATLTACVCAGALAFENPVENRLFALSCFHGDTETIKIVLADIQSKVTFQQKIKVLQCGILLGVEGKQPQVIRYMKSEGIVSVCRTIRSNCNVADFGLGGPYVEMSEFLLED